MSDPSTPKPQVPKPEGCAACPRRECPRTVLSLPVLKDSQHADMLFVYTQPEGSDIVTQNYGTAGATASVMNTTLTSIYREYRQYQKYTRRVTPAVQCAPAIADEKANAATLKACAPRLLETVEQVAPKLIVAFGATALKQLGFKQKHTDVRGRILEPETTHLPYPVLVTFSEKALTAAQGLYETFRQDLVNGFARIERGKGINVSLEELTKDYRTPKDMDEALEVIQEILDFGGDKKDAQLISIDTETTTLRPERPDSKIIAFCFAWDKHKSTTILFDHPHAPPEYLDRLPELEEKIRELLASPKPKTLHNAKFDLKFIELRYGMRVRNVRWCTLGGEHLLDEDKKGNYGLKALTAVWLPHFCGYEDRLYDVLNAVDESEYALLSDKIDTLSSLPAFEHTEYLEALKGHREALEAYDAQKAAWDAEMAEYERLVSVHAETVKAYREAVAHWEAQPKRGKKPVKPVRVRGEAASEATDAEYVAALQAYDAELHAWETFQAAPKPVLYSTRPVRPEKLQRAPDEPKDPRSKKERDFTTDAGFEKVPIHELQIYGAVDGDVTRQLTLLQGERLRDEANESYVAHLLRSERITPQDAHARVRAKPPVSRTRALMMSHVIPASRTLGRMEYYGMRVDFAYADKLEKGLTEVIERTKSELRQMCPEIYGPTRAEFNINSGVHLAWLLYHSEWLHPDGTKMPPVECRELTKKGAESTAAKALMPYVVYDDGTERDEKGKPIKVVRKESYFLEQLFLYKKAIKARDTFLVNTRVLSKRDGKLHTSFHINGTGTGRLSSSDQNLQNIPSKLANFLIKKLFIADDPDTMVVVNADYKGAEVRVFTAYARDPALIKALNDGMDMHSFFASRVFGQPYEDFENRGNAAALPDSDYRKLLNTLRTQIKRTVFGILYGAGAPKIAETIGKSVEEAQEVIDLLFKMFPAIKDYIDETHYLVARDQYVETFFGRRRRFPLVAVSRHRSRAQRQAGNFKIQSTSSDIVIDRLVEIDEMIRSDNTWPEWGIDKPLHTYGVRLLLTVHDSIVLQWPRALLHALEPWMRYYGEERVREKFEWLPVPFKVDIEVGPSYGEVVPLHEYLTANKDELEFLAAEALAQNEGVFEEQELLTMLKQDAFDLN